MIQLFAILAITAAIFIQWLAIRMSLRSWNYYLIKKSMFDLLSGLAIVTLCLTGGVKGFVAGAFANLAITIYLHFFEKSEKGPQPKWWLFVCKILKKEPKEI